MSGNILASAGTKGGFKGPVARGLILEGNMGLRDHRSIKDILRLKICCCVVSPASKETGLNTKLKSDSLPEMTIITSSCIYTGIL